MAGYSEQLTLWWHPRVLRRRHAVEVSASGAGRRCRASPTALLARVDYTGPAPVFESRVGLFASHVQDKSYKLDFPRMVADLGGTWESRNTSFKPYPVAHVIHSFLDALIYLHRVEGLRAGHVE